MTDEKAISLKGAKKIESPEPEDLVPVLTFDDFVVTDRLEVVRASGLQVHLRATTGLAPRPLSEWRAVMNHYQAQA